MLRRKRVSPLCNKGENLETLGLGGVDWECRWQKWCEVQLSLMLFSLFESGESD